MLVTCHSALHFFTGAAKGIEEPAVLIDLMAEDVDVAIIRPDLEALVSHTVPLVQNFLDFILWRARLSLER